MKLTLILAILFSLNLFSQKMTEDEQYDYVEKLAKKVRRDLYRSGHEEVGTEVKLMTYTNLDEYTDPLTNSEYEMPLSQEEIKKIYACKERKNCEVFAIYSWGCMYGGCGSSTDFVLLYLQSKKHYEIGHITYSE